MKIGRKIYYELSTGNVILEISEREGSVIETSFEQDFQSYIALAQRVPSTIGVIKLPYGAYANMFGHYIYCVVNGEIVFGDLINPEIVPVIPQPTNAEINTKLDMVLGGMNDIYMTQIDPNYFPS